MLSMKRSILTVLFAAGLAVPAGAIQVETLRRSVPLSTGGSGTEEIQVASGEVFVQFSNGVSSAAKNQAFSARGMSLLQEFPSIHWDLARLPPGMSVSNGLIFARGVDGVQAVTHNTAYRPTKVPNDPNYASQYHLASINMPAAWEYEVGSSSTVTIAVVDAGIEVTHPELKDKFLSTSYYCDPGSDDTAGTGAVCVPETPLIACNHGTRVAGVAAAASNNGTGVAGVSWGARLLSFRVFNTTDCTTDCGDKAGGNTCFTDDQAIINALTTIITVNKSSPTVNRMVVNLSIGGGGTCAAGDPVNTALGNAVAADIPVFVSAGNGNPTTINKPGNCPNAIPVGATDANNNIASFSSRGPELAANGFVAPGVAIVTTDLSGSYTGGATGTSFSSPIGAGVAALMIAKDPAITWATIKSNLRASAVGIGVASLTPSTRVMGESSGAGLLNAFRAMKLTAEGTLSGFDGDAKVIAFPNPFRPATHGAATITIPTGLQGKNADIRIYTMAGEFVRQLGSNTSWDGKNDAGNDVASGVYILLVKTDAGMQKARLALIR